MATFVAVGGDGGYNSPEMLVARNETINMSVVQRRVNFDTTIVGGETIAHGGGVLLLGAHVVRGATGPQNAPITGTYISPRQSSF